MTYARLNLVHSSKARFDTLAATLIPPDLAPTLPRRTDIRRHFWRSIRGPKRELCNDDGRRTYWVGGMHCMADSYLATPQSRPLEIENVLQ